MTNLLSLIFDAGLSVLLIVTIGYCSRLSKRIRVLQDTRSELAGMIAQFDKATNQAMTSLGELQTVSKRVSEALQLKIEKANFIADDLAFLIEKSTKVANQLQQVKPAVVVPAAPVKVSPPAIEPVSFFPATQPAKPKPGTYPPSASSSEAAKSSASLEALLNRLAFPTASAGTASKAPAPKPQQPQMLRTDAERELLEALKSGR